MTAQFAKDQVSFITATTLSTAAPSVYAPSNPVPTAPRLRAIAKWFTDALRRRSVIEELGMLSDHELSDIGLTRADIPRVFDSAFVANRSTPRAARS
jgi:uncharacterized protein YjiS (DUF1127 family)